jgi:hypothetical protein
MSNVTKMLGEVPVAPQDNTRVVQTPSLPIIKIETK